MNKLFPCFVSLAAAFCVSLLFSCSSDIELPPPPPPNSSSDALSSSSEVFSSSSAVLSSSSAASSGSTNASSSSENSTTSSSSVVSSSSGEQGGNSSSSGGSSSSMGSSSSGGSTTSSSSGNGSSSSSGGLSSSSSGGGSGTCQSTTLCSGNTLVLNPDLMGNSSYGLQVGICVFIKSFASIQGVGIVYINNVPLNTVIYPGTSFSNISNSIPTADGGYYIYRDVNANYASIEKSVSNDFVFGEPSCGTTGTTSSSSNGGNGLSSSSSSSSRGSSNSGNLSSIDGCAAGSTTYNPNKEDYCHTPSLTKGAVCIKISGNIAGWQVSSGDGRTCNVNGGTTTYYPESLGNNIQGPSTSPSSDGYTYINCTAGEVDWSVFSCW